MSKPDEPERTGHPDKTRAEKVDALLEAAIEADEGEDRHHYLEGTDDRLLDLKKEEPR